nr:photosynthetic NDH subunit of subcomplex B 4, chloroplastic [Ipomoea batatas]
MSKRTAKNPAEETEQGSQRSSFIVQSHIENPINQGEQEPIIQHQNGVVTELNRRGLEDWGCEIQGNQSREENWPNKHHVNQHIHWIAVHGNMAEAVMSFTIIKPKIHSPSLPCPSKLPKPFGQCLNSAFSPCSSFQIEGGGKSRRGCRTRVNAFPGLQLMAVMVEHLDGQRDLITHKSVWHLSDAAIKNVYSFYIMFTIWGCCFFGSTKDPYYDSENYRGDGGDGTGHWIYDKQEDIEERSRAELWREELIEEIEQKVEGLRELEEAKEEELVK